MAMEDPWREHPRRELPDWAANRGDKATVDKVRLTQQRRMWSTGGLDGKGVHRERGDDTRAKVTRARPQSTPAYKKDMERNQQTLRDSIASRDRMRNLTTNLATHGKAELTQFEEARRLLKAEPRESLKNYSEWGEGLKAGKAVASAGTPDTTSEHFNKEVWRGYTMGVDPKRKRLHNSMAEQRNYVDDLFDDRGSQQAADWLREASLEDGENYVDAFRAMHAGASQDRQKPLSHVHYERKRPSTANRWAKVEAHYNKLANESAQLRSASQSRLPEPDEVDENKEDEADGTPELQPKRRPQSAPLSSLAGSGGAPQISAPEVQKSSIPIQQGSKATPQSTNASFHSPDAVSGPIREEVKRDATEAIDPKVNASFGHVQYTGRAEPKRAYAVPKALFNKHCRLQEPKFNRWTTNRKHYVAFGKQEASEAWFSPDVAEVLIKPSGNPARMPFGPGAERRPTKFTHSTIMRDSYRPPSASAFKNQFGQFRSAEI